MRMQCLLCLIAFHFTTVGSTEAASVSDVIEKTRASYKALTSFSATGKTLSVIDITGFQPPKPADAEPSPDDPFRFKEAANKTQKLEHTFSLKLARPNLYRIEWKQKVHAAFSNEGFVWSAGDGDFLMLQQGQYAKMNSPEIALGAATGVSGGAANTIPAIFFGLKGDVLAALGDPELEPNEPIEGVDCFVVSGALAGQRMVVWIGTHDHMIRQKRQILGGETTIPEPDDTKIQETLKQLNKEVTPEAVAEMKSNFQRARSMMSKLKGNLTETYHDIQINPALPKDAFEVALPKGLKPSPSPF